MTGNTLVKKSNKKEKTYEVRVDEFTHRHFWLEVAEIAIGIIVAQIITDLWQKL